MTDRRIPGLRLIVSLGALLIALGSRSLLGDAVSLDPAKVVRADRCGRCHESEARVWRESLHARMFGSIETKPTSLEIARRMGIASITRNSVCLDCHYTPQQKPSGDVEAVTGVSCQSCHGAARDWIEIHGNYGGGGKTFKTEAPEDRQRRIENSTKNGMFRPSNLYEVAQNCYRCHTVPNEALVNRGEHGSGSPMVLTEEFEKISHNFLQSFLHGDGTEERKETPERKRVMWIVGWGLDLEYSYRGIAKATAEGVFLQAMARRAKDARRRLDDLRAVASIPQVDSMVATAARAPVAPNRAPEALAAAEAIARYNLSFVASQDGSALRAVDTLIAGWRPSSPDASAGETSTVAVQDTIGLSAPAQNVSGQAVAHVDPVMPSHKSLGVNACMKCHKAGATWWRSDRHANAAAALSSRRGMQIARNYGLSTAEIRTADKLCMDCHAGRGMASLDDGVTCEACHGAGQDYKEPHQDGELSLGLERPGYKKALTLGMVDLRRAAPMAKACVRCHYVTHERLLSSGHPSGKAYDLTAAHTRIKHWKSSAASDADLKTAYAAERTKRGPLPSVAVAEISAPNGADGNNDDQPEPPIDVTLPPFREPPANATIEEILISLKQRLKEIHKASPPR